MKEQIISEIIRNMLPHLDNAQLKQLQETLQYCFWNIEVRAIDTKEKPKEKLTNEELLELFIPIILYRRNGLKIYRKKIILMELLVHSKKL